MVPLISSSTTGPLGAVHLPRLWIKAMLHTAGALPEGYWFATKGFDGVVLSALGIEAGEFIAYVESALPDYPALEHWLRQRSPSLDAGIARSTTEILSREKPPDRAAEHHTLLGCDVTVRQGVLLNDLDDWHLLHHARVTRGRPGLPTIVPALSSTTVGPLGAGHVPRLWLTAILRAVGALPQGFDSDELDRLVFDHLGVDRAQSGQYLEAALPNYVQYERWIREHARDATRSSIAALNAVLHARRDAVLRTDLRDWQALHEIYLTTGKVRR
jgi:hypothetical protein